MRGLWPRVVSDPAEEAAAPADAWAFEKALEREMLTLHHALGGLPQASARQLLAFTGSRRGEGATTIARAYAAVLASLGRRTLLVRAPDDGAATDRPAAAGWDDVLAGRESVERALAATSVPGLWAAAAAGPELPPEAVDRATVAHLFTALRQCFDAVVVDASPAAETPAGLTLAASADGVVLVVDAERTRWPVALKTKTAIARSGGAVLGLVLNRRRFHIPEAIYRLL